MTEVVEILAIVDRSGSMSSIVHEAVGGFNNFVKAQQELDGEANLTLVLFDDQYEMKLDRVPLAKVPEMTVADFAPRGMTATYDAVGKSLAYLEKINPERAIIQIITDGGENASKEYTKAAVQERVKAAEDRGWQVVFLAQNMDAKAASMSLGVTRGYVANLAAGGQGMSEAFGHSHATAMSYRSGEHIHNLGGA